MFESLRHILAGRMNILCLFSVLLAPLCLELILFIFSTEILLQTVLWVGWLRKNEHDIYICRCFWSYFPNQLIKISWFFATCSVTSHLIFHRVKDLEVTRRNGRSFLKLLHLIRCTLALSWYIFWLSLHWSYVSIFITPHLAFFFRWICCL